MPRVRPVSTRARAALLALALAGTAACSNTPDDPAAVANVRSELHDAGYACGKPGSLTLTKDEILEASQKQHDGSSGDSDTFARQLAFLRTELPGGTSFRFETCSRSTLFALLIVGRQKVYAALLVPPDSGKGLARARRVFDGLHVPTSRVPASQGFPLASR